MHRPRILFISPLPPPVHGSAMVSRYIKDSRLLQSSFECDFVNLSTSKSIGEIGKRSLKKLFRFIASYMKVFNKLMFRRYDLCYLAITCHGVGFLKDVPFVLLCKLFGRRIAIHQHNKGMSNYVNRSLYRKLLCLAYKDIDVILLSWRLYPDVEQVVRKEQVRICPNGIPEPEDTDRNVSQDISAPRLLFLSNLAESKGVFVLLDACRLLKEQGCSFVLDMIGGESKEINRTVLERHISMRGLEGYVVYHGPKYGNDKECFFHKADIFVHPTSEDCFPLTVIEAMQHELPVVSTMEGAIPDMIVHGETGFVCLPNHPEQLAEYLKKLLKDSELRKLLGKNGCCRYKERYTLEAFERNFHGILSDMLN